MSTPRTLAVIAALAVAVVACDTLPAGPALDGSGTDQLGQLLSSAAAGSPGLRGATGTGSGGGSVFDRLDAQIDDFAGAYRVAQCSIVLVLTDAANVPEALRIASAIIDPLVTGSCPGGVTIAPQAGTWTYDELHRFHGVALPLVGAGGVYAASVDYALNAVLIVVADRETARRVMALLAAQGVPQGAIVFRVRGSGGVTR
jgi:hypothetical protein